jgi:hypothetical protein
MAPEEFYRGGNSLEPKPGEVRIDRSTGLLSTGYGVSVSRRAEKVEKYGGAFRVTNLPPELHIIQRGRDPDHYEIAPARPMTVTEYEEALRKITLVAV